MFFKIFVICEKAHVKHLLCLRTFGSLKYTVRFEVHTNWGMNHKEGCWSVENTSQLQKGQRTLGSAVVWMVCIHICGETGILEKSLLCLTEKDLKKSPHKTLRFYCHCFILRFVCILHTGNQKKWIKLIWLFFSF